MAPKYRPTPLSGGDRKALTKEIANDPVNRENAALDRMMKGICRGC
jgi:hypothetical protein